MAEILIDIISEGPSTDVAILNVRQSLPNAIVCVNIPDMVDRIQRQLGAQGSIKRLRIFGHGAPGLACVGNVPATLSLANENQQIQMNSSKIITLIEQIGINRQGVVMQRNHALLNEDRLALLRGRFSRQGWVELHACKVAHGAPGEALLKKLASVWQVQVKGGVVDQVAGGGLEGTSLVAYPSGQIQSRPPSPPAHTSAGCAVGW